MCTVGHLTLDTEINLLRLMH